MFEKVRAILARVEKEQEQIQCTSGFNETDGHSDIIRKLLYQYLDIREGLVRIIRCCHCMMISSGTEDASHA